MKKKMSITVVLLLIVVGAVVYSVHLDARKAIAQDPTPTPTCEWVYVNCELDDLPGTDCKITMEGCMLTDILNDCDGEWRFYYKHEEGSWQYVLVNIGGGSCLEGCTSITCSVRDVPCSAEYEWYIICSDEGSTPWRSGYVVCPLN